MIVSDVIGDVASFLDYGTLVIFKASNSVFLKLTSRLDGQLARRLDYALHLDDDVVLTLADSGEHTFFEETRQNPKEVFVEHIRSVSSLVGPHRIRQLYHGRPDLVAMEELVCLVLGAKLVERIHMSGDQDWDLTYLTSLPHLKGITSSDASVPNICALLAGDLTLNLSYIHMAADWRLRRNYYDMMQLENDIVRICCSVTSLPANEERILIVHGVQFSLKFIVRVASLINLLCHSVTIVLLCHWSRCSLSAQPYSADSQVALADWIEYAEFTRLPLDSASFEEKCVAVQTCLPTPVNGAVWIKTAYFSRSSSTAVFVRRYDVDVTNNPDHIDQECHQHDADYKLHF